MTSLKASLCGGFQTVIGDFSNKQNEATQMNVSDNLLFLADRPRAAANSAEYNSFLATSVTAVFM